MTRRVVLIGRTALAVSCLEMVLASGDDVVAVIPDTGDDGTDGWQPSLRGAAQGAGLPILDADNVNDPAFVARVAELRPDFLLSFQAAPILRAPLIETATVAALNLHYGPLPRYRGVSPIAWALLNGEEAHGVTLHVIEPGIDSGPIVDARMLPIAPRDTGRSLYDRCVQTGIELFRDTWPRVRDQVPVVASSQDDEAALYYNRWALDFSDRRIRWTDDCAAIANRTRAFIFPPFQLPEFQTDAGASCAVGAVAWDREPHRSRPGQVLAVEGGLLVVAAPGGRIRLSQVTVDGVPLEDADLVAAGIVPGTILRGA
jgi:methionyl-tRNA formyltransferase